MRDVGAFIGAIILAGFVAMIVFILINLVRDILDREKK